MRQRNIEIRNKAKKEDVRLWEIGEYLGMSESTFSRFLRKELDNGMKTRILEIIEKLHKEDKYGKYESDNEGQRCCGISRM